MHRFIRDRMPGRSAGRVRLLARLRGWLAGCPLAVALAAATMAACGQPAGQPGGPLVAQPLPAPDPFPPRLTGAPQAARLASYTIDARLDAAARTISGRARVRWTNSAGRAVDMLPLHLYMNAFKNEGSVFMRESRGRHRGVESSQEGWGWIDLRSVEIAGVAQTVSYPGPDGDETVAHVQLAEPIEPEASAELDIAFDVQLPEVFARTGYKGDFLMVAQWFPKVGVLAGEHGSETWHCKPFHLSSEFFADFGTYEVSLTVPDTHVVAATGVLTRVVQNADGTRTLGYRAEDVHDFAWMADPYMKVMKDVARTELGEVEVRVYYRAPQEHFARRHLRAGVGAIEEFSRLLVPYPWPIMSIIDPPPDAAGGAGGMEYPTLVTTDGDHPFMRPGMYMPEFVTVHEVGHNWFQGMLASNEVDEAWLDEGVNEYVDALVMEALFGKGTSMIDWHGLHADGLRIERAASGESASIPAPIVTPSYEFPDSRAYGMASYTKTALALRTLESIVGPEDMRRALRTYAQRFQMLHPTGRDFFATLEEVLGRELDWFLDPAFRGIGAVAYDVRSVECRKHHELRGAFGRGDQRRMVLAKDAPDSDTWVCEVLVVNLGRVPAPADVLITFEDDTTTRQRWEASAGQSWQRYRLEHTAPVTGVVIDPDDQVLLNDNIGQRSWRRDSTPGPARRGAARLQYWTQTAMQMMGLL